MNILQFRRGLSRNQESNVDICQNDVLIDIVEQIVNVTLIELQYFVGRARRNEGECRKAATETKRRQQHHGQDGWVAKRGELRPDLAACTDWEICR
jgi:hypothetical protein